MTITVNSLTKKAIKAYRQKKFTCMVLNGIVLTGNDIKLYILKQSEDNENNYFVSSWEYTNNMWKMDWDITISKEGIVHDNSHC